MGFALSIFHTATDAGKQGLYKKQFSHYYFFCVACVFGVDYFLVRLFLQTLHQLMPENKFSLLGISHLVWIFFFEMQY